MKRMNDIILRYIENHNLSRFQLSELLKCVPSTITSWIQGRARPNPRMALKLHKLTRGDIPLNYWGYYIDSKGKVRRFSNELDTLNLRKAKG